MKKILSLIIGAMLLVSCSAPASNSETTSNSEATEVSYPPCGYEVIYSTVWHTAQNVDGTFYIHPEQSSQYTIVNDPLGYENPEDVIHLRFEEGIGEITADLNELPNLISVTFPTTLSKIPGLERCPNLERVVILSEKCSLYGCFMDCKKLEYVQLAQVTSYISDHCFYKCVSLKEIWIPKSVSNIGFAAFGDCTSLSDIYYEGTLEEWEQISIGQLNEPLQQAVIHEKISFDDYFSAAAVNN